MADLTEKQKRFADYYIETGNATESYKKAGYQCSNEQTYQTNACRTLSNAKVKEYIDNKLNKKDNARIASQNEVLEFLTSAMRGELTEEVLLNSEIGVSKQIKGTDIKDRLTAAKELGKRYFTDKQIALKDRQVTLQEQQNKDIDDGIIYEIEEPDYEEES